MNRYIFPELLVMLIRSGGAGCLAGALALRGLTIFEVLPIAALWWLVTTKLMEAKR